MSSSSSSTDPPVAAPNALVNLSIYSSISLIYVFMNLKSPDSVAFKIVYVVFMLLVNCFLIYWMVSQQCTSPDLGVVIGGSVLTWILLFVPMFYLLETMYVWLRPFGNTFGYLFIKLLGVVGFMDRILKQSAQADDDASRRMNKYINYVRSDPWGFFSMLTTNASAEPDILQAGKAFDELRGKLTEEAVGDFAAMKEQFINYVRIKESIAKFVFYLLTLNLMTDMTAVFVMESDACEVNADIVKKSNDVHDANHGGRNAKANANAIVYKTTE